LGPVTSAPRAPDIGWTVRLWVGLSISIMSLILVW
jgi:hypothetical protein